MVSRVSKLRQLREQLAEVEAKISREQARETRSERKKDTRRKILLGAIVLKVLSQDDDPGESLRNLVDPYLVRDDDRALFDLAPREERKAR